MTISGSFSLKSARQGYIYEHGTCGPVGVSDLCVASYRNFAQKAPRPYLAIKEEA